MFYVAHIWSRAVLTPYLMTEPEAAQRLRISTRTLRKFRQSGRLPFVQLGRSIRYRREDLEALVLDATVLRDHPLENTEPVAKIVTSRSIIIPYSQRGAR